MASWIGSDDGGDESEEDEDEEDEDESEGAEAKVDEEDMVEKRSETSKS